MYNITVTEATHDDSGWVYHVCVDGEMMYTVTVPRDYYEKLVPAAGTITTRMASWGQTGRIRPDELVRKSFEFLLAREPKNSILKKFDLPTIQKYFPEYEEEIV